MRRADIGFTCGIVTIDAIMKPKKHLAMSMPRQKPRLPLHDDARVYYARQHRHSRAYFGLELIFCRQLYQR